jgi:hypothetical protein
MHFLTGKRLDVLVLILLMLAFIGYAELTKGLYISKALFAGIALTVPPIIYLGFRKKKYWKKVIVSTIVFGCMFGFVVDFIAEYTKSWTVTSLVFPVRILGVNTIDSVIGFMLMTGLTIVFYEHFLDTAKNGHISRHLKYAVLPGFFAIAILLLTYAFQPTLLHTRYPYLFMGIAAIIPPVILGFLNPPFFRRMVITGTYFFFLYFVFEIYAVNYSYWVYKGDNYIGWVSLFNTNFPFEELFFWMMFYAASLVSYYELFIEDYPKVVKKRKNIHKR